LRTKCFAFAASLRAIRLVLKLCSDRAQAAWRLRSAY
jgi:hypothetical protein